MTHPKLVFVGTYTEGILHGTGEIVGGKGKGIYAFDLDAEGGDLRPLGVTEHARNASYLAFDPARKLLFCVNEFKEFEGEAGGAVSAYRIDPATGALTFVNQKASHGTDPCHLAVDATGRNLLVANYSSGSVAVLPIDGEGALKDASCVIQHEGSSVNPNRQAGPHSHGVTITPDNRFVLVPELGLDKVMIYALDTNLGRLTLNPAQPFVSAAPGAGPRQVVFHPNGRFAYVINELDSTMCVYAYDAAKGGLTALQSLSTLPEGYTGDNSCAEVQVAPSGRFLYGSNRGHDSIVIYAIDAAKGTLTLVGHESTRGHIPRNFCISPDGGLIAVVNQDTDDLYMFRVDPSSGKLTPVGHRVEVGTPVCVKFMRSG